MRRQDTTGVAAVKVNKMNLFSWCVCYIHQSVLVLVYKKYWQIQGLCIMYNVHVIGVKTTTPLLCATEMLS